MSYSERTWLIAAVGTSSFCLHLLHQCCLLFIQLTQLLRQLTLLLRQLTLLLLHLQPCCAHAVQPVGYCQICLPCCGLCCR
jgi:hypothetical protein